MNKQQCLEKASQFYSQNRIHEFDHAIDFATEKHKGQKRRSGEPYIIHPLHVFSTLIDWGMDADTVIAGVLHDTVEDTETGFAEIETLFGEDVAFLVDGVTKVGQTRAGMRDLGSYLPETKDNLSKLLIAVGKDIRVIIIKLADRLHNMQTLQHMPRKKQKKIARETLEVFAPLADRLNMGRVRVQLEELSFKYLSPHDYAATKGLIRKQLSRRRSVFNLVEKTVRTKFDEEKIDYTMDGRVKSVYSTYKKLDKVESIHDIHDIMAFRIIVKDIETCYLVLGEIHELFEPAYERIKDYIAQPKANGYQSLHSTVILENGQHVEFQVRTTTMHEYAERGLAASFYYNELKLSDSYRNGRIEALPEHLSWIKDLQKAAIEAKKDTTFNAKKFRLDLFQDRIFVYSPNGDIYDLPKGAFPLDYAYKVHSEVAGSAVGFIINGTIKPFSYTLQHGDVIEIKTTNTIHPKPDWLNMVITSNAKEKLRTQLRKSGFALKFSHAASALQRRALAREKKIRN